MNTEKARLDAGGSILDTQQKASIFKDRNGYYKVMHLFTVMIKSKVFADAWWYWEKAGFEER